MQGDHDIAQRKRQLLAEGAVYRASLAASLHEARENLRGDSLTRRAAGFAASTVFGMVKGRGLVEGLMGQGLGLKGMLPFAIEAFSLVAKRPFLKKILRAVAVAAAAAGAAGIFLRKKTSPPPPENDKDAGDDGYGGYESG
jgi:hypothetical protein